MCSAGVPVADPPDVAREARPGAAGRVSGAQQEDVQGSVLCCLLDAVPHSLLKFCSYTGIGQCSHMTIMSLASTKICNFDKTVM